MDWTPGGLSDGRRRPPRRLRRRRRLQPRRRRRRWLGHRRRRRARRRPRSSPATTTSAAYLGGGSQPAPRQSQYDNHQSGPRQPIQQSAAENRSAQLVSFTLSDAQKFWQRTLAEQGIPYRRAKLVLYRGSTYSGCGTAQSATGPFYCPADEKIYMDLGFWDELARFGASGEFAQAYVVAHELGHHIQNLLGTERKVRRLQQQEPSERNHLSVDVELQADCFAGVWAKSGADRGFIHPEDIERGLRAARLGRRRSSPKK